jgi:pyroglutamyl-peptidase
MQRRILVTGFEPFGGSGTNPSEQIVRGLLAQHGRRALAPGLALKGAVLPVVGGAAPGSARSAIRSAVAQHRPNVVVCFGEAASRASICVERTAFNERTYRIADNSGHVVSASPVIRGAPSSLESTAAQSEMLRAMRDAVRAHGATVRMSDDAGRFLCNEVLFDCLHRARGLYEAVFIHVPQTPAQARVRGNSGGRPLPVAISVRAAAAAIRWLAQR